ncbi:nitrous oxide reductase accessory protein NosL [Desertibaculum subflavum]|uniref:nitrous oxide reductase accessory protein NosL n=1 Tax=Desertibaculum subflavum TaxID=2268458 RepID=UPI000E66024C
MRILLAAVIVSLATLLSACGEEKKAEIPPPQALPATAVGHYCGMLVAEHSGPKGQIILKSREAPIWFSSARDAFAFTMLPEEAKDVRAIYVSDMAKATSWDEPGATNWVEARNAYYVIGSSMKGGMGAEETVPFSDPEAAARFAREHGGRVARFQEVPIDYVLGGGEADAPSEGGPPHQSGQQQG